MENVLGVSPNDYIFLKLELNVENLRGVISAQHKINRQFVHRFIETDEEFINLKMNHIELINQFIGFAWIYGKTKDSFLASLSEIND